MTTQQTSVELLSNLGQSGLGEEVTANYVEMIETVISSLEQDQSAMVSHTDEVSLWKFKYGSVEVMVQLTGVQEEDTLTVWAPVLKMPARNEPELMRKLLMMNWADTFEARFGLVNDEIVVVSSRTLAGLTAGEVSRIMTVVASIADDNDEALQAEFGNA
jgi:hypothetical protein